MFHHNQQFSYQDINITVKRSKRYKYLRLTISQLGKVELKIPTYAVIHTQQIFAFLQKNSVWMQTHLAKIEKINFEPQQTSIPKSIFIPLTQSTYTYSIENKKITLKNLNDFDSQDAVPINDLDPKELKHLTRSLVCEVEPILKKRLDQISKMIEIPYQKVTVRRAKTRWGSCSIKGNISLSSSVIFLEPHLLDYVIIHELCHRIHFNHGLGFWRLVEQFCPNYKAYQKELKNVCLPEWWRQA